MNCTNFVGCILQFITHVGSDLLYLVRLRKYIINCPIFLAVFFNVSVPGSGAIPVTSGNL